MTGGNPVPTVASWDGVTLTKDVFGLIIDPLGSCWDESGFDPDAEDLVGLSSNEANYMEFIDDETANYDSPASPAQESHRKRLRRIRAILISNGTWQQLIDTWNGGSVDQLILDMILVWIVKSMFWG